MNLIADCDVDGKFNADDDALEMDDLGKIVFANDDDDANMEDDGNQWDPTPGEDDLAPVQIVLPPEVESGQLDGSKLVLSLSGDQAPMVRLWSTPDRNDALPFTTFWLIGRDPVPSAVYVEALGTGNAFLTLSLIPNNGGNAQNAGPIRNELHLKLADVDLDVNNDPDTTDPEDGCWKYRPGYSLNTPVLSSGPFNALTQLAPQTMNAVVHDLGTNDGVSRITGSLTSISANRGYAGNAADPEDGLQSNRQDVSFNRRDEKTRTDTNDEGAVAATRSHLHLYVRDYGATANLNLWVYDTTGRPRGTHTTQVVRDADHDTLQDGWEEEEVAKFQAQYAVTFTYSDGQPKPLTIFNGGEPDGIANEYIDPDGCTPTADGDGGRNAPQHKAAGDSLTPFQEYRGFILDGGGYDGNGQNGRAGGHKRLSPAYKEYLWEVDIMQGIRHVPDGGIGAVLAAASKDFADKDRGPDIRVYWVISEASTPYKVFDFRSNAGEGEDYSVGHRDTLLSGEFVRIMFTDDHNGSDQSRAEVPLRTRIAFVYMEKVWNWCQQNTFDFMTNLRFTVAHEMTHILLNGIGRNGFDDGEHLIDPNEDGNTTQNEPGDAPEVMYVWTNRVNNNSPPVWFAPTIRCINLNSKEGVER